MTKTKMSGAFSAVLISVALLIAAGCQTPQPSAGQTAAPDRPLIGITSVYKIDKADSPVVSCSFAYVRAVAENGGTPIILPALADDALIRHYVQALDGLVLIGGADVPPQTYGEEPHPTTRVMPLERFSFESRLIDAWLASGKPTLGVCLGMQFANVISGGSLTQDIPSQIGTTIRHRPSGWHRVDIDPESHLAIILAANTAEVYSNHHQAVKDLGKNLKIVARSPDGVPEALERTDGPFGLFVQWHPEAMADTNPRHRNAIYGTLIRAATK